MGLERGISRKEHLLSKIRMSSIPQVPHGRKRSLYTLWHTCTHTSAHTHKQIIITKCSESTLHSNKREEGFWQSGMNCEMYCQPTMVNWLAESFIWNSTLTYLPLTPIPGYHSCDWGTHIFHSFPSSKFLYSSFKILTFFQVLRSSWKQPTLWYSHRLQCLLYVLISSLCIKQSSLPEVCLLFNYINLPT